MASSKQNGLLLTLGLLLLLLPLSCAKPKEPAPPPAPPEASLEVKTCAALASSGPLETRMASVFHVQVGGVVVVFGGVDAQAVSHVFERLGLQKTKVVACGADVVVWVPGVDDSVRLDDLVRADLPGAITKELVRTQPQKAPAQKRRHAEPPTR